MLVSSEVTGLSHCDFHDTAMQAAEIVSQRHAIACSAARREGLQSPPRRNRVVACRTGSTALYKGALGNKLYYGMIYEKAFQKRQHSFL